MKQDLYLSGVNNFRTRRFRVLNRDVEETAQLGRLLGLEPKTIIVAGWKDEYNDGKKPSRVTSDVYQIV